MKKQTLRLVLFLALGSSFISVAPVMAAMSRWNFNKYIEDVWVGQATLETGTFSFYGRCIDFDLGSCTRRETVQKHGLKFRMNISLPSCSGITSLSGRVTVKWRGPNGGSFTQTQHYGAGDDGQSRVFERFWEGNYSSTNGNLIVSAVTSCNIF